MYNFSKFSLEQKLIHQKLLLDCVENLGGMNYFLHFLEEIRATSPHVLTSKYSRFECKWAYVTWNKVIFRDKLLSLSQAKQNEKQNSKLLPEKNTKGYKNILNAIYTLMPIKFIIKSKIDKDLQGFEVGIFDIDENDKDIQNLTLNFMFDIVFFASISEVKKVIGYKQEE